MECMEQNKSMETTDQFQGVKCVLVIFEHVNIIELLTKVV